MAKIEFKKHKVITTMLLIAVAAVIGSTGATVLHALTLENPIKTPTVTGDIDENLENGNKIVTFMNHGEADVFIRAAYSEQWSVGEAILPNPYDESGEKLVSPRIADDWLEGKDGWYYYKKVLPGSASGEKEKTVQFITGVEFDEKLDEKLDETYKKASYEIHAVMEIVQASDSLELSKEAAGELFGKNPDLKDWGSGKYSVTFGWEEYIPAEKTGSDRAGE